MAIHDITIAGRPTRVDCGTPESEADLLALVAKYGDVPWLEYGRWCSEHWTNPFQVAGRDAKVMTEGQAMCDWHRELDRRKLEQDGCCTGKGLDVHGECPRAFVCQYEQVKAIRELIGTISYDDLMAMAAEASVDSFEEWEEYEDEQY